MQAKHLALTVFLLLVALIVICAFIVFIFVQRQVARHMYRFGKMPFSPVASGFSRELKHELESKIETSSKVKHEPYIFTEEYQQNWETYLSNRTYTFQYRMLALNKFSQLQQAVLQYNQQLDDAPLIKNNIEAFLLMSQESVLKKTRPADIQEYARLYSHARFGLLPFDQTAYEKFCYRHEVLMSCIQDWCQENPQTYLHSEASEAVCSLQSGNEGQCTLVEGSSKKSKRRSEEPWPHYQRHLRPPRRLEDLGLASLQRLSISKPLAVHRRSAGVSGPVQLALRGGGVVSVCGTEPLPANRVSRSPTSSSADSMQAPLIGHTTTFVDESMSDVTADRLPVC